MAAHVYSPQGMVTVLLMGIATAWSYEYTRSLLPAIVMHMLANLMATAGRWLQGRGRRSV